MPQKKHDNQDGAQRRPCDRRCCDVQPCSLGLFEVIRQVHPEQPCD